MAFAAAFISRTALLCGPENFLAPLLKSTICCTKGETGEARIFRTASPFGPVTGAASAHVGLPSACNDSGHWRVLIRMPVGRKEKIARLRPAESGYTARQAMQHIIGGRYLEIWIPRVGPGGQ